MPRRNLIVTVSSLCLAVLVFGQKDTFVTHAPVIAVTVEATDTSGGVLHYQWRSTDGQINNVNAPRTTWTLPNGPGIHFAYVLVSNGLGGYTERRILINTDTIGTPSQPTTPMPYLAPAAPAQKGDYYRSFFELDSSATGAWELYPPDATAFLIDHTNGLRYPPTGTVSTDLKGQFIIPGVPPGTNNSLTCSVDGTLFDCNADPFLQDMLNVATTDYVVNGDSSPRSVGNFTLQDGSVCGTLNEFFGVHVTATATLVDGSGKTLAGPARVNEFGDYILPNLSAAASVLLHCEHAKVVTVPISGTSTNFGQAVLAGVIPPTVTNMTATLNGNPLAPPVAVFLPPPAGLPSDIAPRADVYLAEKGLDSRRGACLYYKAVGAVRNCDAAGNLIGPISYADWQKAVKIGKFATSGVPTFHASYINKVDLNLARVHESISYGPNNTAAVVCNHVGASDFFNPTQTDIDTAVLNAVQNKNLVACVAMDYMVSPGVNNNRPFIRFLIFGPGGQLLPSVNLDGRREKFVPGTCVVCHGGDHYAGKFPEDGSGVANVGGHFLPYDAGNFEFASKVGLKKCDQEEQIYHLNQNVLNAGPTLAEKELIPGWYGTRSVTCPATVRHVLNEDYVPPSWATQDATSISFYKNVVARSCRTCHAAMIEGFNFDHYTNVVPSSDRLPGGPFDFAVTVCGSGDLEIRRWNTMPNSLVTFNRFWLSYQNTVGQPDQAQELLNFLTDTGNDGFCTPVPK